MVNRTLWFCFYIFSQFALLTIVVAAQPRSAGSVTLFQGPNATGGGQDIPPGAYRVSGKQLAAALKDPVFSVRVPVGIRIRFCEESAAGVPDKCEEFSEGTHNLRSVNFTFINVWTALAVPAVPPVVVFEGANWSGRTQNFGPGMYRADRNEFGKINNDMAMSAIVAKGYKVRFCIEEGKWGRGAGDCEVHEEGRHNLRFADSISFIEVLDLNDMSPADESMPVILYEDTGLAGKMQGFDVGTFTAAGRQFGKIADDTASSVRVKIGYRVMICPDQSPGDLCEEFGEGKHDMKQKDSASYLKVWKIVN